MAGKQKFIKFCRICATGPIVLYQKTFSPDHGWLKYSYPYGFCRFYPSCSEYSRQAILKKGVFRGIALGIWRILRCHPWSSGGVDSVN
ncbi:MAG: membrane protein insertion efficiency factor YidD [Patescibacteria group bacterium]